jgi:hypothetical protein
MAYHMANPPARLSFALLPVLLASSLIGRSGVVIDRMVTDCGDEGPDEEDRHDGASAILGR